ncbi:hypothetical protein [Synechococcus sp. PCC 7336]|uniref:hypothetical protein n=1 Tax=Synechococcus sp. PCC 7336 TaxID=195250 RepID=UPI0003492921|nr:hypothetical protein [Synechococcus sp. PCC 7336]
MKIFLSKVVALLLVAVLFVSGCASTPGTERLSGKYYDDAQVVVDVLREAIAVPPEAENQAEVRKEALSVMEAFGSRYNRNRYKGYQSYTTLRTIFNTLGSYYRQEKIRPIRQDRLDRVASELRQAELAIQRKR